MSAKPLDLAAYRSRAARRLPGLARKSATGKVAIALTAHPDAVSFVIGDREFWFTPAGAHELGQDIIRLAAIAHRGRSK